MANFSCNLRSPWTPVLQFLVTITILGGTSAFIRRSQPFDSVDIINEIPNGDIMVHCQSGEIDQGEHVLPQDADYNFVFNRNYYKNNKLKNQCTVTNLLTGQQKVDLEVWSTHVLDYSACIGNCLWFVRPDGFYVTDFSYLTEIESVPGPKFMAPWPGGGARNRWPVMYKQSTRAEGKSIGYHRILPKLHQSF